MNVSRIIFVGQPGFVKVGAHNTDPTKLVLKSDHPACPAAFCAAFGIEPGEQWTGSVHYIMAIEKASFVNALGNMSKALQLKEKAKALPETTTCDECGGEGGKHWGVCSKHFENKALN